MYGLLWVGTVFSGWGFQFDMVTPEDESKYLMFDFVLDRGQRAKQ